MMFQWSSRVIENGKFEVAWIFVEHGERIKKQTKWTNGAGQSAFSYCHVESEDKTIFTNRCYWLTELHKIAYQKNILNVICSPEIKLQKFHAI